MQSLRAGGYPPALCLPSHAKVGGARRLTPLVLTTPGAINLHGEDAMSAYNIVRFKVKPGCETDFVAFHRTARHVPGMTEGALIKTGENSFCLVAKWKNFDSIVAARPQMIGMLNELRHMLEDQGNGLGVTDPVSGNVVADLLVA